MGFGPGARSHVGDVGLTNIQQIDVYSKLVTAGKKPINKIVHAPLSDNYINCFPKRNDFLALENIEKTSDPSYFLNKLNKLGDEGYLNFNVFNYTLTPMGLNWY
jgi:coproporphyrinogen III oxidase-like Fe-S oxidoreductase